MNFKRFTRRLRSRFFRLRRLGKLRLFLGLITFAAAVAFHLTIATNLVDEQPDDSKLYIQLARNVVEQGVFSGKTEAPYSPTLIRTPGYPFFLAGVYEIVGTGNEKAVRVSQALVFTLACILAGLIASQWTIDRRRKTKAAFIAFVLAAFCPFMVVYSATILAETLTMFFLAATILSATYALKARKRQRAFVWWVAAGLLAGCNVLIRPDAGLFAFGIGLTLVISVFFGRGMFRARVLDRFFKGVAFTLAFIMPLAPWTIRNERLFGVFQPLSPAHAEMPGEFVPHGYFLWLKTWIDDSRYIGPMLWNLEKHPIRIDDVPPSAFSSDEERARIAALLDQYNNSDPEHPMTPPKRADKSDADDANGKDSADNDKNDDSGDNDSADKGDEEDSGDGPQWDLKITPDVDAGFAAIANERIARDPWRYYVWLPAKRSQSMWFDTHSDFYPFSGELLPLTSLDNDKDQQVWLPLFAAMNLIYTLLALAGLLVLLFIRRERAWLWLVFALAISLPRIIFFGTIENPEPRYFVELFIPAAILGAVFLAYGSFRRQRGSIGIEVNYGSGEI